MAHILIVDDDPDILKLAERVLTASGHDVMVAENAVRAMDLLNSTKFDALISDANMPQYSGFELVQTIKSNPRFENMAIAMLTGRRERKDIERAIRIGVDDYIVKPIDPLLFVKKVEGLFVKKPAEKRAELQLPMASTLAAARVAIKAQVLSISELGLVIQTSLPYRQGTLIEVGAELFDRIGIQVPHLRVIQCKNAGPDNFEIRASFVGASEQVLQKLRAWIYQELTQRRVG